MEELNEKQETVQNEELQHVVEATANDNDSNSNVNPEPISESVPQTPESTPETPTAAQEEAAPAAETDNAETENNTANEANTATEEEPEVDYSQMGREELLAAFNELMQEEVAKIRNRVRAIRERFNFLNKEVEQQALKAFEDAGGNKEDFKFENDEIAQEFYKVCDSYRARRQKMQEEIEAQKQHNLEAKRQILEELRSLIDKDEETLKHSGQMERHRRRAPRGDERPLAELSFPD